MKLHKSLPNNIVEQDAVVHEAEVNDYNPTWLKLADALCECSKA